jgi:MscS family membrane protein
VKFNKLIIRFSTILLTAALVVTSASAQDASAVESTSTLPKDDYSLENDIAQNPLKPPDTSSPRATLQSFLENINRAYRVLMAAYRKNLETPGFLISESVQQMAQQAEELFARGVYCLDLSKAPKALMPDIGYERALELKEIFDRIELPPFHLIPDAQAIEQEEEKEKIVGFGRWRVPNTNIVIARVEDGPRKGEYLFTPQTVARLDKFYAKVKDLPYIKNVFISHDFLEFYISTPGRLLPPKWSQWLPAWSTAMYLGLTIWQWCAMVATLILESVFLMALYRRLRSRATMLPAAKRRWKWFWFILVALGMIAIGELIFNQINLTGPVLGMLITYLSPLFWFLLSMAVFYGGNALAETVIESPKIDPEGLKASYLRALFGVIGFLAASVIFLYGLSQVGVSLIPLVTGFGIGGLAVALAAKPTIGNIIGSFTIFLDKPYRVGQRVKVLGQDGTVESIGLRSTKMRLLTGHLTSIPNDMMANVEVENIGLRPYIRRVFNITITFDTPPEKISRALQILREILAVPEAPDPKTTDATGELADTAAREGEAEQQPHPNEAINQSDFPPRISFNEFNADSLNMLVIYWYHPPAYWDYLDHATWVNIQIKERFNAEGIDFALPTQTLHLAGDDKRPLTVGQRMASEEAARQSETQ